MADQFKRNIAFKLRIGDVLAGQPKFDQDKFTHIELNGKRIVRTNIIGNIVDKYESEGDKKFMFLTLDDGSGQLKLKIFGDDMEKFKGVSQGQTVVAIGLIRNWNDEIYMTPEIIKQQNSKYLVIRKKEIEEERSKNTPNVPKENMFELKDKILKAIKDAESEGGVELDKLIMDFREASPEVLNTEIQKFLKEGIVFEPRPGKLRFLG